MDPAGSGERREETPGRDADGEVAEFRGGDGGPCEDKRAAKREQNKPEEDLDPRIQEELERLNEASEEINKLELELDDARSSYRKILTDSARKLNAHSSQLGACIEKARPYYEARRLAKEAQQETQKAALRYERAVSMHTAAREMVYVAEQGLLADKNTLDPTWQEMLNHATFKVNEAEEERLQSEQEHQRVTKQCQEAEERVQNLQKSLKKVILKSKPYFELKVQFNNVLEEHKSKVLELEERVAKAKSRYSSTLRNLEKISEQIHAQRGRYPGEGRAIGVYSGRSPPVGAEANGVSGGPSSTGPACGGTEDCVDARKGGVANQASSVERHRAGGWGQREKSEFDVEGTGSDSASVFSLQTIASDLEKCDSVEHLGQLSDGVSVSGEDGEKDLAREGDRKKRGKVDAKPDKALLEPQEQFLKQHQRSMSL
ncbi:SH3-binding domain protein 5-like, a [Denticeps clupeoides]|uniref:SH3 domain-binding protein 5 n=1 Tax=Denticeps clupeoides TaxID=299321 RepID=A0AAY4EHD1_9TELE|nr:SH3 domain-binding protein 5-like [Denticeps clupeoides]